MLHVSAKDSVGSVLGAVTEEVQKLGVARSLIHDLQVVIDEIYANIKMHVLPDYPDLTWTLSVEVKTGFLDLAVEYRGPHFDPTHPRPLAGDLPESQEDGGMGLNLISALSDDFRYNYHNGMNTMLVRWNLESDSKETLLCR